MSDALRGLEAAAVPRPLRQEERDVVLALLRHSPSLELLSRTLDSASVTDMNDGAMGSIKFLHRDDPDRHFGFELAKATYTDEDGVLVSITLNLDQYGDLLEVDFWKVDLHSSYALLRSGVYVLWHLEVIRQRGRLFVMTRTPKSS